MHLRSNKESLSMLSIDNKVNKKTIRKTPIVKNVLVTELKSNTDKNVSYSIDLNQIIAEIELDQKIAEIEFDQIITEIELDYYMDAYGKGTFNIRRQGTIEITDFETMCFVCPELDFWKCQF